MRNFAVWMLLCAGLLLQAQNLVVNGDFVDADMGRPTFWNCPKVSLVKCHEKGGVNDGTFLEVIGSDDVRFENIIRQKYVTLVEGEEYMLSAMVNTKGFKAKRGQLVITDQGWYHDVCLDMPADTNGWQKVEKRIKLPFPSKESKYDLVVLSIAQTGYWGITDIQLLPLTEKGKAESKPSKMNVAGAINRLFPWTPSFNEVPLFKPVISFKWFAKNDKALRQADLQAQALVAGANFASKAVAVKNAEVVSLDLQGVPAGLQNVTVKITDKGNGALVHEETFMVNLRDIPRPEDVTPGQRLNNFTVEVVNRQLAAAGSAEFVIDHDRWMYFTVKGPEKADFTMTLDGKKIDDSATGLPEAFRLVPAGRHVFAADCGGTLIARTIAEMFTCAICEGPRVTNFPTFDWEYARKWLLPALTHCNRGVPNAQLLKECHDSGRIWSGNLYAVNPPTVGDQLKRIDNALKGLNGRDGVTADELFYASPEIDNYTQALKTHGYDRETLIYTWSCNLPSIPAMHTDFIATAMNASHGRGKVLHEAYIGANTKDVEAARRKALDEMVEYFVESQKLYPDFMRRAGMVLGNFNQINVISLEYYPEIDYKYYIDMQMNILANHPAFKDLSLTGFWGTHYSDDEMYRWSHRVMRHYVVEGRKDMLSDTYGFTYLPGHLVNCDFADGLKEWTVDAAAEGSVKMASFAELNKRNQNRWGTAGTIGNTFCVMERREGKANRVSQVAKNLVPGRKYMLLFTAGDYDDLMAQKFNPHEYGLNAALDDVEIDPQETFIFVDKREKGNYAYNHNVARQNLYRIVFTPKKSAVKVTFSDESAKAGEKLMFNYIQLKPFFAKEAY